MTEIRYWKSLAELNETPEYKDEVAKEFRDIAGLDLVKSRLQKQLLLEGGISLN